MKEMKETPTTKKTERSPEYHLPQRPGFATLGKPIQLLANYFEMKAFGTLVVSRYDVQVTGTNQAKPAGKKLKRIIELFIQEHLSAQASKIATDFKAILLSRTALAKDKLKYTLLYRSEGEDTASPNAKSYTVTLQWIKNLTISDLTDDLTSTQSSALLASKEDMIQALNIIIGHHPKASTNIASIGANQHFKLPPEHLIGDALNAKRRDLSEGIIALRGFFVSVRSATSRFLVNVQVKHGAFYNGVRLNEVMKEFLKARRLQALPGFLRRLTVDLTHINRTNRAGVRIPKIKTITGLAMTTDGNRDQTSPSVAQNGAGPRDVEFFLRDQSSPQGGKRITVYDYFSSGKPVNHSVPTRESI